MKSYLTKSFFYILLVIGSFIYCCEDDITDPDKLLRDVQYFALIRPENDSNISKLFKYVDEKGEELESDANYNGYFSKSIKMKKGALVKLEAIGSTSQNKFITVIVSIDVNGKNLITTTSYEQLNYNQAAVSGRVP